MKIASVFHRHPTTCHVRDSLSHAAELMWAHDIGCLPVLDDRDQLVGMITDRDVAMAAFLQGAPLHSVVIGAVMSKHVVTCRAEDPVEVAIERMIARQLRRLPVVDEQGIVVGIVSLNDIAHAAATGQLPLADLVRLVAAIGTPRPMSTAA